MASIDSILIIAPDNAKSNPLIASCENELGKRPDIVHTLVDAKKAIKDRYYDVVISKGMIKENLDSRLIKEYVFQLYDYASKTQPQSKFIIFTADPQIQSGAEQRGIPVISTMRYQKLMKYVKEILQKSS